MIVASRYAKSLIDLAIETKQLEEVKNDMRLIKKVCSQNPDFVTMLQSPVVKTDKKQAVFKAIFEGKISKITASFLDLIAVKRREGYTEAIAKAFDEQYKLHKHITTVIVTSAIKLDDKLKGQVLDLVRKNVTGEIELVEKVDASLIGGFVLNIADTQVDQSVKRKLNDLRKTLSGTIYLN
ncbi:MAG: ATP synthase F1 subunit delta [Bacteroidetes bacterium]|nr:ATP synthase F1 subunit delta [Bacteroidota bacterium]